MEEIEIVIGSWGSYNKCNERSLGSKWLRLSEYSDWEVIGFNPSKVTLYKEFDGECGEHFKLKIEDGKVVVYIVNSDGTKSIYEKTNISSEYLTETDLINMQDGLEIYSKEELNQIIEDFE